MVLALMMMKESLVLSFFQNLPQARVLLPEIKERTDGTRSQHLVPEIVPDLRPRRRLDPDLHRRGAPLPSLAGRYSIAIMTFGLPILDQFSRHL